MGKQDSYEDDGRTIADMSGIVKPNLFGEGTLEHISKKRREGRQPQEGEQNVPQLTRKERRSFIFGALGAALLIAAVFAAAFALVIFLIILVGKH